MKTIIITGTPGTGKTTLAKKIAKKLNFLYLDVNDFIFRNKLSEGYDNKRRTNIIDVKKLNNFLIKEIKTIKKNTLNQKSSKKIQLKNKIKKNEGIIIDSHLSHYLPKKYADLCIVAKCDIKELNIRLKKKRFNQSKIKENIQAEIFDICYNEAKKRKHKILIVDTSKGFNINDLIRKIGD